MKYDLDRQGFKNIDIIPNCKELHILGSDELRTIQNSPFRMCTFSRVMKEKGIEDAVKSVIELNTEMGKILFELDIYGQIDSSQNDWFESLQEIFPVYICYKGVVPFNNSTEVLKSYDALLFPTFYHGEGFAGTIIDAFAAGLPVIASDWKYNSEILETGNTGILFETHSIDSLKKSIVQMAKDSTKWNEMRINCLSKAQLYLPTNAMRILIERIG